MLKSHVKNVKNGFPLNIEVNVSIKMKSCQCFSICFRLKQITLSETRFYSFKMHLPFIFQPENIVVSEVDFNPEFISRMIPKLEWPALVQAAQQVSIYYSWSNSSGEG